MKDIKRERDDKQFIACTEKWPNWPFLPVKRYNHNKPNCGVLIDLNPIGASINCDHECFRTVLIINLFDMTPEKIKAAERKVYESVDAMLADGWMVD